MPRPLLQPSNLGLCDPGIFGRKRLGVVRMGGGSRWAELVTPAMIPTLILQFPLLQLCLNLIKHHSQLPKDLLQVAHIIVLQDLGLQAGEAAAQAGADLKGAMISRDGVLPTTPCTSLPSNTLSSIWHGPLLQCTLPQDRTNPIILATLPTFPGTRLEQCCHCCVLGDQCSFPRECLSANEEPSCLEAQGR